MDLICGLPLILRWLGLIIYPALWWIGPVGQIIFWLIFFLPIYYTDNGLNKKDSGSGDTKDFTVAFRNSFLIFYTVFLLISVFLLFGACHVNQQVGNSFSTMKGMSASFGNMTNSLKNAASGMSNSLKGAALGTTNSLMGAALGTTNSLRGATSGVFNRR